jgi:hypothetical protein
MRIALALVLCGAAATAAAADQMPKLKPGLWETKTSASRAPQGRPHVSTICLDDSVQQEMYKMGTGMASNMCSKFELKNTGGKVTSESVCDLGGTKMVSKSVMTFIGNTAYRTEAHATFDPPMGDMKETTTVIEGKYLGACKPGQNPGDMTLPDGRTVNIRQMMRPKG